MVSCASFVDKRIELRAGSIPKVKRDTKLPEVIKIHAIMISGNSLRKTNNELFNGSIESQNELVKELEAYALYRLGGIDKLTRDKMRLEIIISDKILENGGEKAWWFISTFTLGVIPFWTKGEVETSFLFYEHGGKRFNTTFVDRYRYIQHILLLPFVFKSKKEAVIYIGKMQIDKFIDELIRGQIIR